MWDKRAEVYVDTLAAVHWRQAIRERDMRNCRLSDEEDQIEEVILGSYKMPDPYELEGRMLAFASYPVRAAAKASDAAGLRAANAAADSAQAARRAADDANDVLMELIRAELQGKARR